MTPSRRLLLQGAMAVGLTSCDDRSVHADEPMARSAPLKAVANCPVGTCLATPDLTDPQRVQLTLQNFGQVTPEWEMKMEQILADDGTYRFEAADALARFCGQNRLMVHGTTLAWYAQDPVAFERLAEDRRRFELAYRGYIATVVGRYRGLTRGWDVVNEAVAEQGDGYRGGVWQRVLGPDYARIAFEACREADPQAIRFINDYNLESKPAKLDTFQRLVDRLLKLDAPVNGIGTQTHLSVDMAPRQAASAIRELAKFGLPIHVSELDVSTRRGGMLSMQDPDRLQKQARLVAAVAEAFMALPQPQRYAITVWGVRDKDSWLRRPPNQGDGGDQPLLFTDEGQPKPAFDALEAVFARHGGRA